ncbi:MAG: hypothetical protein ABH879_06085 [archaeon]
MIGEERFRKLLSDMDRVLGGMRDGYVREFHRHSHELERLFSSRSEENPDAFRGSLDSLVRGDAYAGYLKDPAIQPNNDRTNNDILSSFRELRRYAAMVNLLFGHPKTGEKLSAPYSTDVALILNDDAVVAEVPFSNEELRAVLDRMPGPGLSTRDMTRYGIFMSRFISDAACYNLFLPFERTDPLEMHFHFEDGRLSEVGLDTKYSIDFAPLTLKLYESAMRLAEFADQVPVFNYSGVQEAKTEYLIPTGMRLTYVQMPTVNTITFRDAGELMPVDHYEMLRTKIRPNVDNIKNNLMISSYLDLLAMR